MDNVVEFLRQWDILGFVIAGIISAFIALIIDGVKVFFNMKRQKYCISKSLISSAVYQNSNNDGLKIRVSYNDAEVEGPITILTIRLRNDGSEDLLYSQRISSFIMITEGMDILKVSVNSNVEGIDPLINKTGDVKYELGWKLLKQDECIFIKIIAKGEINGISSVKFVIRADGIDKIKTPEFKVRDVMIPVFASTAIIAVPIILFWPADDLFIGIMPMKLLMLLILAFMALFVWISALLKRIKWMNEK